MIATHHRIATASFLAVTLAVLLALVSVIAPVAAQSFGNPEPGRNIYNRAGLLTPVEVAMLEERGDAVEQAGAPVVVYLQTKDADFDETLQDARDLMDAWDVQSAPDARDGVVIMLNLDPDNPRRGELAVVAGEAHFDGGNLPQHELDRIADAMIERLADDDTAGGIAVGLDMIANSLINGPAPPPPPSAFEEFADSVASGPISLLNALALALAAVFGYITLRVMRDWPSTNAPATPTTTPPSDLIPALAGALVTGRTGDAQFEATVLDLARRGALSVERESDKKVRIRLHDPGVPRGAIEQRVWESLEAEADSERVIVSKRVSKVRNHWPKAHNALRIELLERGWYSPDASKRRAPAYIAGAVALLLGLAAFLLALIGGQLWGLVAAGLLVLVALTAFIGAGSKHDTTAEGQALAQSWRGYLQGLKSTAKSSPDDINLDVALPYALAMNAHSSLSKPLKQASESGYIPLWLGQSAADQSWGAAGFYPYYIVFHSGMTPASSGGSGGGGASSGSGGAGGSF